MDKQQLPQDVLKEIEDMVMKHTLNLRNDTDFQIGYEKGMEKGIELGATSYAQRAYEAERERDELKRWKESAKALLNPVWDFADANVKMSLGECKIQAVLNHFADLKAQADKMAEALKWIQMREGIDEDVDNVISGALADYQGKKEGGK